MDLSRFLMAWRTVSVRDREVIDALVHPDHAGPSAELVAALARWPGTWYWSDEDGRRHLVLTRPRPGARRDAWALNVALLLATLFTTTWAGATMSGTLPYAGGVGWSTGGLSMGAWLAGLAGGLPFSVPLIAILLAHELGHYFAARAYQLDVSPPYFIPLPLVALIGTMGAFIRLRTVVSDRRQLLDVGAAGPFAGFVVALPVLAAGLANSRPSEVVQGVALAAGDQLIPLGDSLLTLAVRIAVTGGTAGLELHPVAFAGWFGMFVTMLNLLPLAQLDGGHILFAAAPRWHQRAALAVLAIVVALGAYSGWEGWWVFGTLVLVLSRGRISHPPLLDVYRPLPPSRRWLAWGSLALFVLTFAPAPFRL